MTSKEVFESKFEHLWLDKLTLTGRAGHHINETFYEAFEFARDAKVTVELDFNGVKITINGRGA